MEDTKMSNNSGPKWRDLIPGWGHKFPFLYIVYLMVLRMAVWLFIGVVMSVIYFAVLVPVFGADMVLSSLAGLGEMLLGWFWGVSSRAQGSPWAVWFGFVTLYMFHLFFLAAGGNENWSIDRERPPLWRELGLWSVVGVGMGGLFLYAHVVENPLPIVPLIGIDVALVLVALLVARTLNLTINEDEQRFNLFTYGPAFRMGARLPLFYLAWVLLVGVYGGLPTWLVWGVATLTPVVGVVYVVFRTVQHRERVENGTTKSIDEIEAEIDDDFWNE
jgi:hypothetical protein